MVAPTDPKGINKLNSPGKLDHEIDSWGFVHGRVSRTRLIIAAIVLGVGLVTLVVAFLLYRFGTDNYHEVVKGEFYRSRELTPGQLERHIRNDEIACVIRLVGVDDRNADSFRRQQETMAGTDANLVVASLATSRKPWRHELRRLYGALHNATPPVLIH